MNIKDVRDNIFEALKDITEGTSNIQNEKYDLENGLDILFSTSDIKEFIYILFKYENNIISNITLHITHMLDLGISHEFDLNEKLPVELNNFLENIYILINNLSSFNLVDVVAVNTGTINLNIVYRLRKYLLEIAHQLLSMNIILMPTFPSLAIYLQDDDYIKKLINRVPISDIFDLEKKLGLKLKDFPSELFNTLFKSKARLSKIGRDNIDKLSFQIYTIPEEMKGLKANSIYECGLYGAYLKDLNISEKIMILTNSNLNLSNRHLELHFSDILNLPDFDINYLRASKFNYKDLKIYHANREDTFEKFSHLYIWNSYFNLRELKPGQFISLYESSHGDFNIVPDYTHFGNRNYAEDKYAKDLLNMKPEYISLYAGSVPKEVELTCFKSLDEENDTHLRSIDLYFVIAGESKYGDKNSLLIYDSENTSQGRLKPIPTLFEFYKRMESLHLSDLIIEGDEVLLYWLKKIFEISENLYIVNKFTNIVGLVERTLGAVSDLEYDFKKTLVEYSMMYL